MNINIRKLENLDIPFLWDMVYESAFVPEGQRPFPRTILDEPSVSRYVDGWGKQRGDMGFIVEIDKKPIGAIWLRLFDEVQRDFGDDETPEIGMAILEKFRGKGIGKSLLSTIETEAKKYGYRRLCLSVDPRNPACRLYNQFGYVQVGWFETYWTMEKELV